MPPRRACVCHRTDAAGPRETYAHEGQYHIVKFAIHPCQGLCDASAQPVEAALTDQENDARCCEGTRCEPHQASRVDGCVPAKPPGRSVCALRSTILPPSAC